MKSWKKLIDPDSAEGETFGKLIDPDSAGAENFEHFQENSLTLRPKEREQCGAGTVRRFLAAFQIFWCLKQ